MGLPAGLKSQGAIIAGIPRTSGTFPVTIRGFDDQGNTDVRTVTLNVNGATSSVSTASTTTTSTSTTTSGAAADATSSYPSWWNAAAGASVGGAAASSSASTLSSATSTSSGAAPAGSTTTTTTVKTVDIGPIPVGYTPSYPTGAVSPFPSQTFPTGASPNFIPSSLPTQIQNYNYDTVTTRDTYTITQDDVKSRAVYERQINANKVVANLLSIIQQLTANVNGVQADIPAATAAVNQAIADQRATQQKIVAA